MLICNNVLGIIYKVYEKNNNEVNYENFHNNNIEIWCLVKRNVLWVSKVLNKIKHWHGVRFVHEIINIPFKIYSEFIKRIFSD